MLQSGIYLVAIIQIVMLYWLTARKTLGLIDDTFLSKNRAWVERNPSFKTRHHESTMASLSFYALGSAWLVLVVLAGGAGAAIPAYLTFAPTMAWLVLILIYAAVAKQRIGHNIPLPAKRSVLFARRSLRDFVSPMWTTTCFVLFAVAIAFYAVGYARGLIATDVFVGRMAGFAIMLPTASVTLLYCLRRKHQPIDDAWGPSYRRMEVRGNIVVLYLCLVLVAWCMLQDFFAAPPISDVAFFSGVNLMMQAAWLRFFNSPAVKQLLLRV
ncbi:hypothetical protein PO883_26820 [Massilia sp. DJPM01]|uniref:hypothetical protein n=1 Tax=Massilia sp. DJPM01 TaxID=3024404 RepID=UPI00259FB952|nr:hypothetical protein [Massilia sp. DJPM01]MDM5180802.1 hypothetical protein [Massilia sp. DJPM01]